MSDPKIDRLPGGPANAEIPDDPTDDLNPDKSFNDDIIGARLKMEEVARQRAVQDRAVKDLPRELLRPNDRVERAVARRPPLEEPDAARRARLALEERMRGEDRVVRQRRRRASAASMADLDSAGRILEQIIGLFEELEAWQAALLADDEARRQSPDYQDADLEILRARARSRLERLIHQTKGQLQQLLAGGVGFHLAADPTATFRPLISRLSAWPSLVPPGHAPEAQADFDAFLKWIFAPPVPSETPPGEKLPPSPPDKDPP